MIATKETQAKQYSYFKEYLKELQETGKIDIAELARQSFLDGYNACEEDQKALDIQNVLNKYSV